MPKSLPDIIYSDNKIFPVVDSNNANYLIPYYKNEDFFMNYDSLNTFIKSCESAVRNNDRYSKYIYYLKTEVKLNHCQVLKSVDDDDASIEMHHGPIFTLYDYCLMVTEYFLMHGYKITTFRIADTVLEEHLKNHIQVVMLSSTIHEEVHNRDIFINYKQAFGDLNAFLKKYGEAMDEDLKIKLNRYIDRSLVQDSNDYGILKLNKFLYKGPKDV